MPAVRAPHLRRADDPDSNMKVSLSMAQRQGLIQQDPKQLCQQPQR